MKFFSAFIFILFTITVFSQTSSLGLPEILKKSVIKTSFFHEMSSIDTTKKIEGREKRMEYGKPIDFQKNIVENSKIDTLQDGSLVYQFGIWCKGALSINLVFNDFQLKPGSTLYLVGASSNKFIGAYTSLNNSESHYLGTDILEDDKIIIELKEPQVNRNTTVLNLETVVHGYQSIHKLVKRALNSSGICNIDVNCPEGNGFENQRNAVVLILNGAGGLCTGTMLNSTIGPIKPYMISAYHCGTKPQGWVYRFRWEAPTEQADCGTTTPSVDGPRDMTINGCSLVAKSKVTDFLLCELNTMPDPSWNVYFSGWNKSGAVPSQGVGIHHPYADIKKISMDFDSLHTDAFNPGEPLNHWRTNWDKGITEVGSSGSPLFDENHLFIGQLHGGDSDCISDFMTDFYGKMADSWNGEGTDSTRLKTWLDPLNIEQDLLEGAYLQGSSAVSDDVFLPFAGSNLTNRNCKQQIIPYVFIGNAGTNTLTKATISYSYDGVSQGTIDWNGSLNQYELDTVFLPETSFGQGEHTLSVTVTADKDEVLKNNSLTYTFNQINDAKSYRFELTLDNKGAENNWKITDKNEETVFYNGGPYDSGTPGKKISETFCLSTGCYKIKLNDYNGNGMTDVSKGSFYLIQESKDTVASLLPTETFKSSLTRSFCDETNVVTENILKVFPNPINQPELTLQTNLESISEVLISDLSGKQFASYQTSGTIVKLNTDFLKQGMYLVQVKTTNHTYIQRVVVL